MTTIQLDMTRQKGVIKPMNAVNNGPDPLSVRESYSNFHSFKAAGIPYARNHDASFNSYYDGEHLVDVHRIFKNFDADENDPASYVFAPTDKYVATTIAAGTKVFYRLGASIEHGYKYGTYPPGDYGKWARICEHIIRHYTQGWADGFTYDIEYWEIWNEPDCANADGSNPCWQGTPEEFEELYCVAARHLKECFPEKKIGGPAFCTIWDENTRVYKEHFLDRIVREQIPLDFFSYHWYGKDLNMLTETIKYARKMLDDRGLYQTEAILNEWNYVRGWLGDDWKYTLKTEKNLKGASFITGAMCIGQGTPLDMFMYYDARACEMCGLFRVETYECLKGYYSISAFSELTRLGNYVDCGYQNGDIYYCAAANEKESAVLLTYFDDEEKQKSTDISLEIVGLTEKTKARIYLLDEENNLSLVKEVWFDGRQVTLPVNVKLFSTYLIRFGENE